jgi:hypothetical protein
MLLVE